VELLLEWIVAVVVGRTDDDGATEEEIVVKRRENRSRKPGTGGWLLEIRGTGAGINE